MTAHIFIGPGRRNPAPIPDADGLVVHGPVQHGDLLRLGLEPNDVVGIVDGLFYDRPAIRPKEILMVAGRGVRVIGGSSMGALRAADLAGHGMTGVGRVYSWLMSGVVTADHEVAVLHGDAESGFRPITVALVSARDALDGLVQLGGVSPDKAEQVLNRLGSLYFADRSMAALRDACAAASIPSTVFATVREIVEGPNDVKVRDAVEVTDAVLRVSRDRGYVPRAVDGPSAQPTDNYETWLRELSLRDADIPVLARARAVQAVQLFSPAAPSLYAQAVRHALATEWKVDPTTEAIAAEFSARTGLRTVTVALAGQWLYPTELRSRPEDLCRLAVAAYRVNPGLPAWDALAGYLDEHCDLPAIAQALAAADMGAARNNRDGTGRVDSRVVLGWLGHLWDCDAHPDVLRRVGYTRGFRDVAEAYRSAIRFLINDVGPATISTALGALR